jgi:hypothetical protein
MVEQKIVYRTSPMWVLFLVFLCLKLTGTIAWSWWIVTLPLWIGLAFALSLFLFVFGILFIVFICAIIGISIFYLFKFIVGIFKK